MSHVRFQYRHNLNLRLSELRLGAVMFLQIYTIVFAQIHIHQTSPQLLAGTCSCRAAHVLTNSLDERELVQIVASLLKSEK